MIVMLLDVTKHENVLVNSDMVITARPDVDEPRRFTRLYLMNNITCMVEGDLTSVMAKLNSDRVVQRHG
jgi:hypothetical protein